VEVVEKLSPGVYKVELDQNGQYIVSKREVVTDKLIDIPYPEMQEVMDSIKEFYASKELFEKWDFVFKRGFLMHGPPGGGKTSIISRVINYVAEELGGVVFTVYNEADLKAYAGFIDKVFRQIEPTTPVVTVLEDIDGLTGGWSSTETLLINMLDGLGNHKNVLNIATTNYPERLSDRIMKRPNRFDRKIEIKTPDANARKVYFEQRILAEYQCCDEFSMDEWVGKTEGMTMAQMSEMIKSVCIFKVPMDEVIEKITGKRPAASWNNTQPIGFMPQKA